MIVLVPAMAAQVHLYCYIYYLNQPEKGIGGGGGEAATLRPDEVASFGQGGGRGQPASLPSLQVRWPEVENFLTPGLGNSSIKVPYNSPCGAMLSSNNSRIKNNTDNQTSRIYGE